MKAKRWKIQSIYPQQVSCLRGYMEKSPEKQIKVEYNQ